MYSDKENVNILTALLLEYGIHHAVVCPGSRNAPIIHNFNEAPGMECFPVTDERSAGFYALGMAQALGEPVVVCVTSGTALLNLAPAVAEAFYQQVPLVVVSADRPQRWIGQLDGQTLPQEGALLPFVKKAVALPMLLDDEEERWFCNRLVNEALLETGAPNTAQRHGVAGPVHINVPINEPLFHFTTKELPKERMIYRHGGLSNPDNYRFLAEMLDKAKKPMLVIGQYVAGRKQTLLSRRHGGLLDGKSVVLTETLAHVPLEPMPVEDALTMVGDDERFWPDTIVCFGGTLVSKNIKRFLRKVGENATVIAVVPDGQVRDVTMHMDHLVVGSLEDAVRYFDQKEQKDAPSQHTFTDETLIYKKAWDGALQKARHIADEYQPAFSQMAVVRYFEQQIEDMDYDFSVHYANSMAVRLANIFALHPVWCNRGVNGIEGTLSTAAGFSIVCGDMVFCVIGDLSFFYDQNALWNQNLKGNLRVILLNNGQGGIFHSLKGLEQSQACERLVAARHNTSARGICEQNDVGYLQASNIDEMKMGVVALLTEKHQRPMLLEVFTDVEADNKAVAEWHALFTKKGN